MIERIHHVQLAMPAGEESKAEAFYVGVLGSHRVAKPPNLEARGGAWFASDTGVQIHLGVEEPFTPAQKAHPAFVVRSLAETRTALEAAGAEIVDDEQLDGFDRFYTSDPFGNRIEILSPVDPTSAET